MKNTTKKNEHLEMVLLAMKEDLKGGQGKNGSAWMFYFLWKFRAPKCNEEEA